MKSKSNTPKQYSPALRNDENTMFMIAAGGDAAKAERLAAHVRGVAARSELQAIQTSAVTEVMLRKQTEAELQFHRARVQR